jgi:hypothetical protein
MNIYVQLMGGEVHRSQIFDLRSLKSHQHSLCGCGGRHFVPPSYAGAGGMFVFPLLSVFY